MAKYRTIEEFNLPEWINNQRAAYRRGEMSPERIKMLEAFPNWRWNKAGLAWETGYQYTLKYGVVGSRWKAPDGYALGRWQHLQRTPSQCVDPERRKRLEKIPGWAWKRNEAAWNAAHALGMKYGGFHSDQHWQTPEGFYLGAWLANQRKKYQNPKSDPKRRKLLEMLPDWSWNPREERWQENYKISMKYGRVIEEFQTPDGVKLGFWQKNVRKKCKDSKKLKLLRLIPGWLDDQPVRAKKKV